MSYPRSDDALLLGSEARFIADLELEGMLHCAFVRSVFAHARISIHVPSSIEPITVLTAADLGGGAVPSIHAHGVVPAHLRAWAGLRQAEVHQPILAVDRVLFVGQPIALVVAADRYVAEDTAEDVEVDYEHLPVITSPIEALRAGATELSGAAPGNRSVEFNLRAGRLRPTHSSMRP